MNNNIITIEKANSVFSLAHTFILKKINNIDLSVLNKMVNKVVTIKDADFKNRMQFFDWFYKLSDKEQIKLISKVIIKNQTAFYFDGLHFRSLISFQPLLVGEEIHIQDFKNISIEDFKQLSNAEKIGRWGAFYEI